MLTTALEIISFLEQHSLLVTTIGGLLGLSFQIHLQHLTTLKAQKEQVKTSLKVEIFKEFSGLASRAIQDGSGIPIWQLPGELERANWWNKNYGVPLPTVLSKAETISAAHQQSMSAYLNLLAFLERYEITIPGLVEVRQELGRQLGAFASVFSDVHQTLLSAPAPSPKVDVTGPGSPNSRAEASPLESKCQLYFDEHLTLQSYVTDISVIMKNELLGKLFESKVDARKPLDPSKHKVLKLPRIS
jgi:hypothetical protein